MDGQAPPGEGARIFPPGGHVNPPVRCSEIIFQKSATIGDRHPFGAHAPTNFHLHGALVVAALASGGSEPGTNQPCGKTQQENMHAPTAHQLMAPWSSDDTEKFLNDTLLPVDFLWTHDDGTQKPVQPRGGIKNGYGFWLRYTPYFPGLFEEVHDVLLTWKGSAEMPRNRDELASELSTRLRRNIA